MEETPKTIEECEKAIQAINQALQKDTLKVAVLLCTLWRLKFEKDHNLTLNEFSDEVEERFHIGKRHLKDCLDAGAIYQILERREVLPNIKFIIDARRFTSIKVSLEERNKGIIRKYDETGVVNHWKLEVQRTNRANEETETCEHSPLDVASPLPRQKPKKKRKFPSHSPGITKVRKKKTKSIVPSSALQKNNKRKEPEETIKLTLEKPGEWTSKAEKKFRGELEKIKQSPAMLQILKLAYALYVDSTFAAKIVPWVKEIIDLTVG